LAISTFDVTHKASLIGADSIYLLAKPEDFSHSLSVRSSEATGFGSAFPQSSNRADLSTRGIRRSFGLLGNWGGSVLNRGQTDQLVLEFARGGVRDVYLPDSSAVAVVPTRRGNSLFKSS